MGGVGCHSAAEIGYTVAATSYPHMGSTALMLKGVGVGGTRVCCPESPHNLLHIYVRICSNALQYTVQ